MAKRDNLKKIADIANEGSKYNNLKSAKKIAFIQERFDDTTENDNPYDDAIQYIHKKLEDIVDESNFQIEASSSLSSVSSSFSTTSGSLSTRVTTLDTASSSFASTSGSLSTRVTTLTTASSSFATNVKRDTKFIYFPVIANFSGNINTAQFIPLSDGETEGTNQLQRRNNFIAPAAGTLHKVFIRSNASLLVGGKGTVLTGVLNNYVNGTDAKPALGSATVITGATSRINTLDFSSVNNNSFSAGDRLLISLQAALNTDKNYYVTAVFKLDQSDLD